MHGMDRMVQIMARAVGKDLPNIIRTASLTPSELTGVESDVGSIECGKLADIVVLGPGLEVKRVFSSGVSVYSAPVTQRARPGASASA